MICMWVGLLLLQVVKPRDFDELRSTYIRRINEMFDQLAEKYQQLDTYVSIRRTNHFEYLNLYSGIIKGIM